MRKLRLTIISKLLIFNSLSFNRVHEEKLMILVGNADKLINEDKYHLGYEVLFSTHSSPMVPKESPIKVLYLRQPADYMTNS